ncbi:FecR domain-containing protein [Aquimarina sp. TRL1]|uniref:FecR family protein n=1 Tax=Aquimarina sp. (strain TRL1) TaxID=2736252 RepID=UPI00158F49AD|nr:FecR family protein [Aquimarina sp. TRL1]QKX05409.1 FecR domain-containing protein [Aquimarina sp. TRL1]
MSYFEIYKEMDFEELVENPEFQSWVYTPSSSNNDFWKGFLKKYPEKQAIVDEAKMFLLSGKSYFEQYDKTHEEIQLELTDIFELANKKLPLSLRSKRKVLFNKRNQHLAIAASFAVLFFLGYFFYKSSYEFNKNYTTDYAEWQTVKLPDASVVELNANSTLKLSKDWKDRDTRKVWLEGEAFFDVEKNLTTHSKFQVIVNDLTIEVLGTEFNVQSRGDLTKVFLKEGKIKLLMNNKEEYLYPGDFITYSSKKQTIISRNKVPQESYTSWRTGTLQMNDTVDKIFKEIENIYGVNIELEDENLYNETRKIGIPMKNLDIVIPILEISLDVEIIKDKNKLIVRQNN